MYATITLISWAFVFTTVYEYNKDAQLNSKPTFGAVPIVIVPANQGSDDPNKVFTINFSFYNKVYM